MAEENREDVKSKAVVTYSRQRHPEHYKKLKENFNLKQPLGSRLQQSSKWQSYVRGSSSGKQDQFTRQVNIFFSWQRGLSHLPFEHKKAVVHW